MKTEQMKTKDQVQATPDLTLIKIERGKSKNFWRRLEEFFSPEEMTAEDWRHFETRRVRPSDHQQRRL